MTRFRRLALVTTAATYLLIAVGGLVRATDSGLGCPEWGPTCHGRLVPPANVHAWIEHSHRAVAGIVVVLVLLDWQLALATLLVAPLAWAAASWAGP